MTVTRTHHRQVGDVLQEVHCRELGLMNAGSRVHSGTQEMQSKP